MSAPETWTEIRRRHEVEKARAIHAHMGGTMQKAADALDMDKSTLDGFLRHRGLRWNRAELEAVYPEITSTEAY